MTLGLQLVLNLLSYQSRRIEFRYKNHGHSNLEPYNGNVRDSAKELHAHSHIHLEPSIVKM